MTAQDWEDLRARAVDLLASAAAPGDAISKLTTRVQAEEVAHKVADLLVANMLFPIDSPEGHRLAQQLAVVAGTEQDIMEKLRPVT